MARKSRALTADTVTTEFVLNIAPIQLSEAPLQVSILPHQSQGKLAILREQYRSTHVFHDMGNGQVLSVPVLADAPAVGNDVEVIRLQEQLDLSVALVRNALLNYLYRIGRPSQNYDPIEITGNASNENLLALAVPFGCPDWLAVRPSYQLAVRVLQFDQQPPFIGLVLSVRAQPVISLSCAELVAQGISLLNLLVGQLMPQPDERLAPRFERRGQVTRFTTEELLLADATSTEGAHHLTPLAADVAILEPNEAAFERCLQYVFRQHTARVQQELTTRLTQFLAGPKQLPKLQTVIDRFSRLNLEVAPGVDFKIHSLLAQGATHSSPPISFPAVQSAPKPIYVFDDPGERTHTWNDGGLKEHGPYSSHVQALPSPQIAVICQRHRQEEVEAFLHKWLHGIPASARVATGREKAPFTDGLLRQYALPDAALEFIPVAGGTPEAYLRGARLALEQQLRGQRQWSLILVQTDEFLHGQSAKANPYLLIQATLLAQGIPSHEFTVETTRLRDKPLGYALHEMALACYAKLGGIPWLLKTNPTTTAAQEYVIGLNHVCLSEVSADQEDQLVAITTVFTANGNYCGSQLSPAVPASDYAAAMLSTLAAAIEQIQAHRAAAQPPVAAEAARVILHVMNPQQAVAPTLLDQIAQQLASELGASNFEIAIVQLEQDHPYRLFDQKQHGAQDYERHTIKGAFAPTRGSFVQLTETEVLLSLMGAREIEYPLGVMPRPVLLRLHPLSTFRDLTYLARQVFAFSCHSWHNFFPTPLPVTVGYAQLMAQQLQRMAVLPNWNPQTLLGCNTPMRWFL